jgi:hypothetical protein
LFAYVRVGPYLIREVAFWRDLLSRIAVDLDRGADRESDPQRRKWLRARACQIRKRLDEGVPSSWKMSDAEERRTPQVPSDRRSGPADPRRP